MALEHRISFRVEPEEWVEYQAQCSVVGTIPSQDLRSYVRNQISRKGGNLTIEDTIEDFIGAYVYEWDDFGEALSLAIDRDEQAANALLQDIKNIKEA